MIVFLSQFDYKTGLPWNELFQNVFYYTKWNQGNFSIKTISY